MTPAMTVFVMMSNYFHDVATAMPLACSVTMWMMMRRHESSSGCSKTDALQGVFRGMRVLVCFSWVWILTAGALRIITFTSYEWPHAIERSHEGGLILKYAVAIVIMAIGTYLWSAVRKKMRPQESDG